MSWRRLVVLVRYLPPEAALFRAAIGPDAEWRLEHQLQAGLFDLLALMNYNLCGAKGTRPAPLARPGNRPAPRVRSAPKLDMAQVHAYLSQFAPRDAPASEGVPDGD